VELGYFITKIRLKRRFSLQKEDLVLNFLLLEFGV
jgi:hypothetical protein